MATRRPYVLLAIVCSGWGTIGLVVRSAHMPATPIACSRIWIATAGLGAALVGFALVAGPAAESTGGVGLVLAIVAGVSMIVLVLVSKPLAEVYGGLRFAFAEFAVAGVVLVPVGAFATWGPVRATWSWIIVL